MAERPTARDQKTNPLIVASLAKGMGVLSALAAAGRPLNLAEISKASGVGRSAAQRFVFTLNSLGYLDQNPANKRYTLSARMLQFGEAYSETDSMQQIAYPVLQAANRLCEETINLTILRDHEVVYILRLPSRHVISVDLHVGARLPAYCTAPGRAILAYLDPAEATRILELGPREKRTPRTETDPERLMSLLAEVRNLGYSINDQECFLGDISTAAVIRDRAGFPVAAVNIAVPSPRWTVPRVQSELTPIVLDAAGKISNLLGWRGGNGTDEPGSAASLHRVA